ncbi:hypothetical protein AYI70_g10144, partial [Smittium culicis]
FILGSFVASQQGSSEDSEATTDFAKAAESVIKGKTIESITYKDLLDIFSLLSSSDNNKFAINLNSAKRNVDPELNRYNRRGIRSKKIKGFDGESHGRVLGSSSEAENKSFLRKLTNSMKKRYQSSKVKVPEYIKSTFSVLNLPKIKPRDYKMMGSMKPRAESKIPDISRLYNMKRKIQTSSIRISSTRAKRSSILKRTADNTKEVRPIGSMKRRSDTKSIGETALKNMKKKPQAPAQKSYEHKESMARRLDAKNLSSKILKNMKKKPEIKLEESKSTKQYKKRSTRSKTTASVKKDYRKMRLMKKRAGTKSSSTAILKNMAKKPQEKAKPPKYPKEAKKRSTGPITIRSMKKRAGVNSSSATVLKNMKKKPQSKFSKPSKSN